MAELYTSYIPFFAVAISLLAVPFILLSSRKRNLREFWTIIASLGKFGLVLSLLPDALAHRVAQVELLQISPGIGLALRADPLGVFFALIASGLWVFTSFYSIGYMRGLAEHKQTRYFASFAVCLSATMGIAFSANILTFLTFYEMLTLATYPLVIHKETPEAISAGRKYLLYTLSAGVLLIGATAWTYNVAGSLDFRAGGLLNDVSLPAGTATGLFILFLCGVGVKAAIMPLHSWLPTAMAAPTPVSALLHAVAVVKAGVFGVMRVVGFVFGPNVMIAFGLNDLLGILAGLTIVVASLLALREDNLKRRLAYSTVGHLSYIVLGAALLSPSGFTGGLMHIATHATMKITLFFCAGAIYVNVHKENISELDGIGKAMPWTMGAFTVGAIGLAGVPPVNGFVSKWFLGAGTLESGNVGALLILLVSGLLNAGYFFPIIHKAFFKNSTRFEKYGEASKLMVLPLVATAILSVLFGLWPNLFLRLYDLSTSIAMSVLGGTAR
ncbi:MAG: monovalent cation/H+ antiporter subunit D family protein [Ignavibacteriae bacterium]|nr:monovalent cation/H+ antiporter subunit D family protein [Ignavibacteriota bacterium]